MKDQVKKLAENYRKISHRVHRSSQIFLNLICFICKICERIHSQKFIITRLCKSVQSEILEPESLKTKMKDQVKKLAERLS